MKLITKIKYIIAAVAIFIIATITFAIENEYKNNLLNITLKKIDDSNVELMLFMQKPFHEPVSVIKKSDFEYVVMLADTYHSITSKPSITAVSPLVSNIDVKLFPYLSTANNGYTKITVLTSSRANITAKTFISSAPASKSNDLVSEIEALIAKKPEPALNSKTTVKKQSETTKKTIAPVKPLIKHVDKELQAQKTKQKETVPKIIETIKVQSKPKEVKEETKQESEAPTTASSSPLVNDNKIQDVQEVQRTLEPQAVKPFEPKKQNNDKDFLSILFVSMCIPLFVIAYFIVRIRSRKNSKKPQEQQNEKIYQAPLSNLSKVEVLKEPEVDFNMDFYKNVEPVDFVEQKPKSLFDEYLKQEELPKEDLETKNVDNVDNIDDFDDIDDFEGLERLEDLNSLDNEFLDEKIHYKVIENPDEPEILDIFTISDSSGFYLTKFENKISLIGYIHDEIIVLKTFENFNNPKLIVKLDSENDLTKKFLVKIGKKKFIFEVSPYDIKLLIEL